VGVFEISFKYTEKMGIAGYSDYEHLTNKMLKAQLKKAPIFTAIST
jgi:hypothetical protein